VLEEAAPRPRPWCAMHRAGVLWRDGARLGWRFAGMPVVTAHARIAAPGLLLGRDVGSVSGYHPSGYWGTDHRLRASGLRPGSQFGAGSPGGSCWTRASRGAICG
jgi:hypothetical protein